MNKKRKVQVVVLAQKPYSDEISKVLLLQTNKKRGGFWQNVTGSVEKYERFLKAALRELWEETGISAVNVHRIIDLKLEHTFLSRNGHPVQEKSFAVVVDERKISLDPKEHQHYKWLPIKSIRIS